jgi:uncharacterized phage protein gp47/JayE
MAIEIQSFTELSTENIFQTEEFLSQLLSEENPSLDAKRGVLKELLLHYNAIYDEKNTEELDRLRRSSSLQEIQEDPSLADDDAVDRIASNYRITRKAGEEATGVVRVVLDRLQPITIAQGSSWESEGRQFVTLTPFAAKTTANNVIAATDRLLVPLGDGNFYFNIEVTAVEVGEASAVKRNSVFTPQQPPLYFVTAYASQDFINGIDEETNAALSQRLVEGAACKALSGSVHMSAALRDQPAFENVLADSVIGFGDGEMLRDKHSLFPIAFGGRVDWYIRSQRLPQLIQLNKTATLVSINAEGYGVWQFGIGRNEVPGFYDVFAINLASNPSESSFEIATDSRNIDLSTLDNDGFLPDIQNTIEGAYSRFQAAVIQFVDTTTPVGSLTVGTSTQEYEVIVRGMPLISDIQDYASSRGVRNRAGDILVKAPVPCFLRVSFAVQLKKGTSYPDVSQIRTDVAELVNTYGFTGRLPASAISDIVHNSLSGIQYLSAIDMLGDIRGPDGNIRRIRSTETLIVPSETDKMISPRTVAFFLDPQDIAITVEIAPIPEI